MSSSKLPPIRDLLKESWEIFTKTLHHFLVLSLISFLAYTFLSLLVVAIGFSTFAPLFTKGTSFAFTPNIVGMVFALVTILLLGSLVIAVVWQASMTLIINDYQKEVSYRKVLKHALSFIFPIFVVGGLSFFFGFGAMFLLFFPSLVVAFFLMFSQQEVILGEKHGMEAIRGSIAIIKTNAGPLFLRFLLMFGISFLVSMVLSSFVSNNSPTTIILHFVLSIIVNTLLTWFSLVYFVTLYKQAKKATLDKKVSIWWLVLLGIVGWLLGLLIISSLYTFFSSQTFKKTSGNIFNQFLNQYQSPQIQRF